MKVEQTIEKIYTLHEKHSANYPGIPRLLRVEHGRFLNDYLRYLPSNYSCLDASRAWLCYWIVHSLSLLDIPIDRETKSALVSFLNKCQNPDGGFGGGPGQLSHLATTYASVLTLCILGTEEAYEAIDREALQRFLWRVRSGDGAFCMHEGGNVLIQIVIFGCLMFIIFRRN